MSLKKGTTDIAGIPTNLINTVNSKADANNVYTKTEADNRYVNITGDTMSGGLTVPDLISTGVLDLKLNNVTKGINPTSDTWKGIHWLSSNSASIWQDNRVAVSELRMGTDGSSDLTIGAYKNITSSGDLAYLKMGWDASGKKWYDPVQLIATYVNGNSGYNIWSNGYCEQWGQQGGSGDLTCYLMKTYRDTNYQVLIAYVDTSSSETTNPRNVGTVSKAVNSFVHRPGSSLTHTWRTFGYLASGQY